MADNEVITTPQVAAALGVSVKAIYKLRAAGKGPVSHRRGRVIQWYKTDVDDYLAREREATRRGGNL
ncbi:helix-turn-helix transcriptional regulator [Mycobacteroides abscessus subsp. abscessus]|uniref:helix-turn-helix transcriptional regulator n=1 Tax=Mycobacteroides abscessus TaxID=36809 RepID=UPI0039F0500E